MLKKKVSYVDYNGNQVEEELYFNMNTAELTEKQFSVEGGYAEYLQKVSKKKDPKEIFEVVTEIILMSYGVKSEDGKRFIKSKELTEEFKTSEAYSTLLYNLLKNPNEFETFVKEVFPSAG